MSVPSLETGMNFNTFLIQQERTLLFLLLYYGQVEIMWYPFKRIRCQCTFCGHVWRIPRRRILRFERFFEIKKGSAIGGFGSAMSAMKVSLSPDPIKIFMEKPSKLIPKPLSQIQKLFGFDHYSIVPLFHHSIGVALFKMPLE